jgi:hypothetical protein
VEGDEVFVAAIRSTVLLEDDAENPTACFEEIEHRVADLVNQIAQ